MSKNVSTDDLMVIPTSISRDQYDKIIKSLPITPDKQKLELLPDLLSYWCEYVLPDHVFMLKKHSDETVQRLENASKSLAAADAAVRLLIESNEFDLGVFQLVKERASIWRQSEFIKVYDEVDQALAFLLNVESSIAAILNHIKPKRGRPRNRLGYFVISDLAAIFKWITGTEPVRRVSWQDGYEIGAFYDFTEMVWIQLFDHERKTFGTSFKRWADYKAIESSPIVANFFLRLDRGNG